MQRVLIMIIICLCAVYSGMCVFTATQKVNNDMVISERSQSLCPLMVGSDGTAAGNLFNQICKGE